MVTQKIDASYIDWAMVYDKLGLSAEYAEFMKANAAGIRFAISKGGSMIPVVRGVSCGRVNDAFDACHLSALRRYSVDRNMSMTAREHDPNKTGSYAVLFADNAETAENLEDLPMEELTFLEYLILAFGFSQMIGVQDRGDGSPPIAFQLADQYRGLHAKFCA